MTRQDQLAAIRQKCIETNPEPHDGSTTCHCPIRLADVLLAVQDHDLPNGYLFFNANWRGNLELSGLAGSKFAPWNLRADDLDQQSDETISFIHSLLTL